MNLPYIGYTYIIRFLPTSQVYYGSRCAKGCHPSEFWVTYFTSSKVIKSLIKEYGKEAFTYKIRKTFTIPRDAQIWERKVLRRVNAGKRQEFLNKSNGVAPMLYGWKNPFFGKKHSEKDRAKMRGPRPHFAGSGNANWKGGPEFHKYKKKFATEEERQQAQSEMMKTNNPMNNDTYREKISVKARQRVKTPCQHCNKMFDKAGMTRHLQCFHN